MYQSSPQVTFKVQEQFVIYPQCGTPGPFPIFLEGGVVLVWTAKFTDLFSVWLSSPQDPTLPLPLSFSSLRHVSILRLLTSVYFLKCAPPIPPSSSSSISVKSYCSSMCLLPVWLASALGSLVPATPKSQTCSCLSHHCLCT